MKRENFERAEKLLRELSEVNESIDNIRKSINELGITLKLVAGCGLRKRMEQILINKGNMNILLKHYEFEKERIEKELEEL